LLEDRILVSEPPRNPGRLNLWHVTRPVPVGCAPHGAPSTPPGSDCNVTTTVNAVTSGTLVAGKLTSITVFRLRVNDHANALFQQQGSLVP